MSTSTAARYGTFAGIVMGSLVGAALVGALSFVVARRVGAPTVKTAPYPHSAKPPETTGA